MGTQPNFYHHMKDSDSNEIEGFSGLVRRADPGENGDEEKHKMEALGSSHRPVMVKVNNEQRAIRVAEICEEYGFKYTWLFR